MNNSELKIDFAIWSRKVLRRMIDLSDRHCNGPGGGCLIDAMIPFNMGWSIERTAYAFLGFNHSDRKILEMHTGLKRSIIEKGDTEMLKEILISNIIITDDDVPLGFENLVINIKEKGIGNPPVVHEIGDGKYRIVNGRLRILALKQLGADRVNCTVV